MVQCCGRSLEGERLVMALGGKKYHQACIRCKVTRERPARPVLSAASCAAQTCACEFPEGKGIFKSPSDARHFLCKQHYLEAYSKKVRMCPRLLRGAHSGTDGQCQSCGQFIVSGRMITSGAVHWGARLP